MRRRHFLIGSGAFLLAGQTPRAHGRQQDVDYEMRQVLKGGKAFPGKVRLNLPRHSDAGTSVPMTLSVDGPLGAGEYPEAVHVYGTENPRPRILTVFFTPACGRAEFSTRIRLDGAQSVAALARMNDGTFWTGAQPVSVTFGACAQVGTGPGMEEDYVPVTRIAVPATAKRGEIVKIRTLISHPMETGLRLDAFNQFVPLRIIERFTCFADDEQILSVRLEPAVSTNPFFEFYMEARKSAEIRFEWLDTIGKTFTDRARMEVSQG